MTVSLTILVIFGVITISAANAGIRMLSESKNTTILSVNKVDMLKFVRKPRGAIVGHGCAKGKIWKSRYRQCIFDEKTEDSDYIDVSATNGANTFTPKLIEKKDNFLETMNTNNDLSVLPLTKPDMTTELNTIIIEPESVVTKSDSEIYKSETVAKSTSEVTGLYSPASISIPEMIESTPATAHTTKSAAVDTKPTTKNPKIAVTELNHVLDDLSSTILAKIPTEIKFKPTVPKPELTVTQQELLPSNLIPEMSESTPVAAELTSTVIASRLSTKEPSTTVAESKYILEELSSTVVEIRPTGAEPDRNVPKLEATVSQQKFPLTNFIPAISESTPTAVETLATTDSTPIVSKILPATMDTATTMDSSSTLVEVSLVATETKAVVTTPQLEVKDNFYTVVESTPTWIDAYFTSVSKSTLLLTVTESSHPTTDSIPNTNVYDSLIPYKIQSVMYTFLLIGVIVIICWIVVILWRRRRQERRDIPDPLMPKQENIV